MEISEILGLLQGRLVGIQIYRNIVKDVTKAELERLSEFIERNEATESDILHFYIYAIHAFSGLEDRRVSEVRLYQVRCDASA